MKEKKFESLTDLLDFVLRECGDMNYDIWGDYETLCLKITVSDHVEKDGVLEFIYNLNIERIYYAMILSKKLFNATIVSLKLSEMEIDEIDEGWLSKMDNLEVLDVEENNLYKLPQLPKNITDLFCSYNNLSELPELPEKLTDLFCHHNPGFKVWVKDPRYRKYNLTQF